MHGYNYSTDVEMKMWRQIEINCTDGLKVWASQQPETKQVKCLCIYHSTLVIQWVPLNVIPL